MQGDGNDPSRLIVLNNLVESAMNQETPCLWRPAIISMELARLDKSDDAILTLVTCCPFYFVGPAPKRFIVRAHRISG